MKKLTQTLTIALLVGTASGEALHIIWKDFIGGI